MSSNQFITRFTSDTLPKAIGPYCTANVVNMKGVKTIYTSGIIALTKDSSALISEDVEEQTKACLTNLKILLEENDACLKDVVKVLIFLKDMEDFSKVNTIYSTYFTNNYPARSCVQVSRLPKDAKIELEVIAYKQVEVEEQVNNKI